MQFKEQQPDVCVCDTYISQNHRMVWVGRDLKDHLVPGDTFH